MRSGGPISSLRRGLSLTQGNAPAFAVLGALIGAAALGVYAVLAFVLEPLPGFLGELVAVSTATTLTAPLAAHTFVRAFDGRAAGRRLAVRPPQGTDIAGAGARGRSAIQRTLGSLGRLTDGSEAACVVYVTSRRRLLGTSLLAQGRDADRTLAATLRVTHDRARLGKRRRRHGRRAPLGRLDAKLGPRRAQPEPDVESDQT